MLREIFPRAVTAQVLSLAAVRTTVAPLWPRSVLLRQLTSETSLDQAEGSVVEQAEMADETLRICCPTVPGFSLKDKLWGKIPSF